MSKNKISTKDFPAVRLARKAVEAQLKYYDDMINEDDNHEEISNDTTVKSKLFVIETMSLVRNRYVVEAPDLITAHTEVRELLSVGGDIYPAEQKDLGEFIFDSKKITKKKFKTMLKKMEKSGEGSFWMGDELIHKVDDGN